MQISFDEDFRNEINLLNLILVSERKSIFLAQYFNQLWKKWSMLLVLGVMIMCMFDAHMHREDGTISGQGTNKQANLPWNDCLNQYVGCNQDHPPMLCLYASVGREQMLDKQANLPQNESLKLINRWCVIRTISLCFSPMPIQVNLCTAR